MKKLQEITPKKNFLALFNATVLDLGKEKGGCFEAEAKRYEKEVTLLEAKRKRIFEMREDGSSAKEELAERKAEVENELIASRISRSESRIEQFDVGCRSLCRAIHRRFKKTVDKSDTASLSPVPKTGFSRGNTVHEECEIWNRSIGACL